MINAGERVIITINAYCCEIKEHQNIPMGTVCFIVGAFNNYGVLYNVRTLNEFGIMTATFTINEKHLVRV